MPSSNILESNISNVPFTDPDLVLIKMPLPSLIFDSDLDNNKINLNGNFNLVPEVIRNVYTGVNVNSLQVFKLSKIYITFKVSTNTQSISFNNTYVSTHTILTSSMFIINDNFTLPNNIDINKCTITSFKISANYVFGDNSLFSYITSTNSSISLTSPVISEDNPKTVITNEKILAETSVATAILQNKLDFLTAKLEAVTDEVDAELFESKSDLDKDIDKINKIIEKLSSDSHESDDTPKTDESHESHESSEPDPYATLYWVVPLSIIICIIVYTSYNYGHHAVKYFRKKSIISEDSDFGDTSDAYSNSRHHSRVRDLY